MVGRRTGRNTLNHNKFPLCARSFARSALFLSRNSPSLCDSDSRLHLPLDPPGAPFQLLPIPNLFLPDRRGSFPLQSTIPNKVPHPHHHIISNASSSHQSLSHRASRSLNSTKQPKRISIKLCSRYPTLFRTGIEGLPACKGRLRIRPQVIGGICFWPGGIWILVRLQFWSYRKRCSQSGIWSSANERSLKHNSVRRSTTSAGYRGGL